MFMIDINGIRCNHFSHLLWHVSAGEGGCAAGVRRGWWGGGGGVCECACGGDGGGRKGGVCERNTIQQKSDVSL